MPDEQRFERYNLFASAIGGRHLHVARAASDAPTWTDGATIFVAEDLAPGDVLSAIAVQSSLLAAGSFDREIMTKLERRTSLTRRYLAIEGHRALAAQEDLLPSSVRSLIDHGVATGTHAPGESLAHARSSASIAPPPDVFGSIRPRAFRKASALSESTGAAHLSDAAVSDVEENDGPVLELSSAWVGRGGAIGRLFKRLFADARASGTGPPGTQSTTYWTNRSVRAATARSVTVGRASRLEDASRVANSGHTYPEWDVFHAGYRPDWCTVVEVDEAPRNDNTVVATDTGALRKPLMRVGLGLERRNRQLQGVDVDIDAAIEAFSARETESVPEDACYVDNVRRPRDLSVLVLLDISGSSGESSATGGSVHDQQRAAAASLVFALHDRGDRVALYGFRSLGRTAVHAVPVKRFDDRLDARVLRRLGMLTPSAYTRLGAAIRHGAATLETHGGTPRRLLVVISDGFAYDHGYEGDYGEADARRALAEARRSGIGCLCLSIGAATEPDALRRVFGAAAHASLAHTEQLPAVIGPLFRAALRSAESQQRKWQRAERTRERLAIDRRTA
ncbi:MAG TPA: VWA domain-containing protein [Acidimicrobiia bacterium]